MIFTPSNFLSLLRGPLAFFFILDSPLYRTIAIILAMITDCLDGYLARRYRMTSQVGAVLDPIMDKFFVFFALTIFIQEGKLEIWQAFLLISRDFAIFFFGLYLAINKSWSNFQFRSIWSGKIITSLQFFVLIALTFNYSIPPYLIWCFLILGISALFELYFIERRIVQRLK